MTPESKTQHSGDFLIAGAVARPLIVYLRPCVSCSAAIRLTVSEVTLRLFRPAVLLGADLSPLLSEWPPLSPPLFTSSVLLFRQGNRGQEAAAVIRSKARFPAEIGNKHSGPFGGWQEKLWGLEAAFKGCDPFLMAVRSVRVQIMAT